jgi:hypothetical protein
VFSSWEGQFVRTRDENEQLTVTSMSAHLGTRVPSGTGLGKLDKILCQGQINKSSAQQPTYDEGGRILVQLKEYSDQLIAGTPRGICEKH